MEYTHFVSVAALVLNSRQEVLLVRHPQRGWEFPGGMAEPHETLQQALLREIKEETGVRAEIAGFAGISKNIEMDIVNLDFICSFSGGALQTSEESVEVRWFSKKDALNAVRHPLTAKRLKSMLLYRGGIYCFGFRKESFETVEESCYGIGLPAGKEIEWPGLWERG